LHQLDSALDYVDLFIGEASRTGIAPYISDGLRSEVVNVTHIPEAIGGLRNTIRFD